MKNYKRLQYLRFVLKSIQENDKHIEKIDSKDVNELLR